MPLPKVNLSAKERARNKRAIPSKKERQRMRASEPRRRLAKQAAGNRRLTTKNLAGRLLRTFNSLERWSNQVWLIKEDSPLIIGRTGKKRGSLVFRMGNFTEPITGEQVPIVAKVGGTLPLKEDGTAVRKNTLFVGGPMPYERHARNARILSLMGIPTYRFIKQSSLGKRKGSFHAIFLEDLTRNGKMEVIDLIDCKPEQVSNMGEIMQTSEKFIQKLLNRKPKPGLVSDKAHLKNPNMRNEMERVFFVIINPKTRKGTVFAGDLDHFDLVE